MTGTRSVGTLLSFFAVFLLLPGPGGAARADVLYAKDGTVLRGRVTERGDQVWVQGRYGTTRLPAEEVERIEWEADLLRTYRERDARIAGDAFEARIELAAWCRIHGLDREAKEQIERILAVDPDHAEARAWLGQVKVDGVWLPRREAAKRKGLVWFRGRYVKPEEKAAALAKAEEEEKLRRMRRERYRRRRTAYLRKRWRERYGRPEPDRGAIVFGVTRGEPRGRYRSGWYGYDDSRYGYLSGLHGCRCDPYDRPCRHVGYWAGGNRYLYGASLRYRLGRLGVGPFGTSWSIQYRWGNGGLSIGGR